MLPGHILTGPVAVEGAEPGDVLEVEILDISLRQNWGWNVIRPLAGTLPDDFHEARLLNIPLDKERMVGKLPWGLDLPLAPFFGVMGTAPPPAWGRITHDRAARDGRQPRQQGADGRAQNSTCRCSLPERCFPAATAMARKATAKSASPRSRPRCRANSSCGCARICASPIRARRRATHYITMGMDPDLDQCVVKALRDMIVLLGEKRNLSREDAYTLCSLAADLRVTQTVNGSKGIHCMIAKSIVHAGM